MTLLTKKGRLTGRERKYLWNHAQNQLKEIFFHGIDRYLMDPKCNFYRIYEKDQFNGCVAFSFEDDFVHLNEIYYYGHRKTFFLKVIKDLLKYRNKIRGSVPKTNKKMIEIYKKIKCNVLFENDVIIIFEYIKPKRSRRY